MLGGRTTANTLRTMTGPYPILLVWSWSVSSIEWHLLPIPVGKHSWEPLFQYFSHFPKVLCTLYFLLHDSVFSCFCFKWRNLMWYSDLALAFESRDWKPWCLSFAAPLDTRSSPFIPMISPSSSQEELQTTLGKFCFDISVQWGPTF